MTRDRSCGARCAKEYGIYGTIGHVRLVEAGRGDGLVGWRGFRVTARLCGRHKEEASHSLRNPTRDAARFVVGALVGRKSVADLCEPRKAS
jgi:hypothetical protein